jgi:hypothetical protein
MITHAFNMKKLIYILVCFTIMGFSFQRELYNSIQGDFDGDGVNEKATIITVSEGQNGNGEDEEYYPAIRKVIFSNKAIKDLEIGNAGGLYNIGDINKNQTHEILIAGYHSAEPFSNTYSVYTFDKKTKYWKPILNESSPVGNHGVPENWVISKNDTIYYWSSTMPDHAFELKDTLRWIKNNYH